MATANSLTAARLREALHYAPSTGVFTWRVNRGGLARASTVAGSLKKDGYIHIGLDGIIHRAHRLAWLYVYGEWPSAKIDHKDTIRHHNWIDNLRDVTQKVNSQNLRAARANKASTNLLGVYFYKKAKRWTAQIGIDGKTRYLGCFDTPEFAHAAYLEAKRELHAGCTI